MINFNETNIIIYQSKNNQLTNEFEECFKFSKMPTKNKYVIQNLPSNLKFTN